MSIIIIMNVNIMRHWVEVTKFVDFAHVLLQIFKGAIPDLQCCMVTVII